LHIFNVFYIKGDKIKLVKAKDEREKYFRITFKVKGWVKWIRNRFTNQISKIRSFKFINRILKGSYEEIGLGVEKDQKREKGTSGIDRLD